jgi:3-oxoacyl-(acyl-carrier-protein) synthase
MLSRAVYINGLGTVSPAGEIVDGAFTGAPNGSSAWLKCIDPAYAGFIELANIRRLGRLIKTAMVAAKKCLLDGGILVPDAIITGTGLGCMEDTEKFLKTILDDEGNMASPTAFIHSTHNTISSQIAISLKCQGYNSTYVHRAFSFESAVMDAVMQLMEEKPQEARNILVGGADEMSPLVFDVMGKLNFWKAEPEEKPLYQSRTDGTLGGEGTTYCLLSNQPNASSYAQLLGLRTLYKPAGFREVQAALMQFLAQNRLKPSDLDLVVMGNNGDARYDGHYQELAQLFGPAITLAYFKQLCGEYFTASAFGLVLSALAVRQNELPAGAIMQAGDKKPYRKMLLYNQFRGVNHSFYLLSDVEL